jgi:hypothetical protein
MKAGYSSKTNLVSMLHFPCLVMSLHCTPFMQSFFCSLEPFNNKLFKAFKGGSSIFCKQLRDTPGRLGILFLYMFSKNIDTPSNPFIQQLGMSKKRKHRKSSAPQMHRGSNGSGMRHWPAPIMTVPTPYKCQTKKYRKYIAILCANLWY